MNWTEIGSVVMVLGALGGAGKFYGDNTYVLVADSLQGQYFQLQRDIKRIELNPEATPEDKAYADFLRLQKEELRQKLGIAE